MPHECIDMSISWLNLHVQPDGKREEDRGEGKENQSLYTTSQEQNYPPFGLFTCGRVPLCSRITLGGRVPLLLLFYVVRFTCEGGCP